MSSSLAARAMPTEDQRVGSTCQTPALAALRDEIDVSGVQRKVIAAATTKGDESLLSKRLSGVPDRPFPLADLDKLPRAIVVAWLKRYGSAVGVKVVDLEPGEVNERLLLLVDELATVAKLARVVTRPIKASR